MDIATDKALKADKRWDTAAEKKFNAVANKMAYADKRQDGAAELSMIIKDKITKQIKLRGWIRVG